MSMYMYIYLYMFMCERIYISTRTYVSAQEWTNRTVNGHEPLICSKMYFTKTELVQ